MKSKILVCILLVISLSLLAIFMGCGKQEPGDTPTTDGDSVTAAGDRIPVVFWHSYISATIPALKQLIARFEEEHPNIDIQEQYVPTGDQLLQKLTTAIMTKSAPDVCWIHANWVAPLSKEEAIYDLGELADKYGGFDEEVKADFFDAPLETSYYKGKLRMMPIEGTNLALAYNKDLFRAAGLDPNDPPDNWDEYVEYGHKLTDRESSPPQWACTVPVFTGNMAGWCTWQFMTFLWGWGGNYANPDGKTINFNSPEAVGALQFWVDLQNKYKVGTLTAPEQGFETQRVAMAFMGPWDLPRLEEMTFDWGIAPMPAGPVKRVTSLGAEYLVIFRQTKHEEAAWTFLTWFIQPEIQEWWSKESKYLPIRKSVLESPTYQEYLKTNQPLKVFAEQMAYAYAEPNVLPQASEVDLYLATAIEQAVRVDKPTKVALDEAAAKANKALAEAWEREQKEAAR